MSTKFTDPCYARQGVVAGFVLSAPDYWGVHEATGQSVEFQFYNMKFSFYRGGVKITVLVGTGYQHWINVGGRVYNYTQQIGDSIGKIAQTLYDMINGAPDPSVVAAFSPSGSVTLTPRLNTGAMVMCSASDSVNLPAYITELTGTELTPLISKGALYAQGQLYQPASSPVLPAAPASQRSWLYYSSTSGWYWSASSTPTASDDACVGWVVADATMIVALSSGRMGTGPEAVVTVAGPVSGALGPGALPLGDTDVPPAPIFGIDTDMPGEMRLDEITFATLVNTNSVDAATYLLYYIVPGSSPLTLTAAMADTDTSMSASAALPYAAPGSVQFGFSATSIPNVTIGPGYEHNIVIGTNLYTYIQQTPDTAATIAAALAQAINEAVDINATATASGNLVTLWPTENTGASVICTASDGCTPATMTELQPAYAMCEGEIIRVEASDGSAVVRGQKGSTAVAHSLGANVWPVYAMARFYALPPMASSSAAWPTVMGEIPFAGYGLVAADLWVTNALGNSPTSTNWYGGNTGGYLAPTGTSGGSGSTPGAPNIASIAATSGSPIAYGLLGNASVYQWDVTLTLPTADTAYIAGHLRKIHMMWAPSGALAPTELAVLYAPWSGSTLRWISAQLPQPPAGQAGSLEALTENDDGALTRGLDAESNPPAALSATIQASVVTSASGVDASTLSVSDPNYYPRWKGKDEALHTVINATVASLGSAQYPQVVTIWLNKPSGRVWMGWWQITAAGQAVPIGLDNSNNTTVYPPINSAENWTATLATGAILSGQPVPAGAYTTAAFSVPAPPAPASTEVTNAWVTGVAYAQGSGGSYNFQWSLNLTAPFATDPNFWYVRITLQTGTWAGGVFTPGGAHPNEVNVSDFDTPFDYDPGWVVTGSNTLTFNLPQIWVVPGDANTCHRMRLYVGSRLNSGTQTQQSCWSSGVGVSTPGVADHQDMVVDGTKAQVLGSMVTGQVSSAATAGSATTAGSASTAGYASTVPGTGVQGVISAGGGGVATTYLAVLNASSQIVAWAGLVGGNYGIWAANFWAGGTGPASAKIWLDAYGNAWFVGTISSGSTITGASFATTSGAYGWTVHIDPSGSLPVYVYNGSGYYTTLYPGAITVAQSGVTCTINPASASWAGVYNTCTCGDTGLSLGTNGTVNQNYVTLVSTTGVWTGNGVSCSSYGVTCYSATVGAGGVSVNGTSVINSSGQFIGAGVSCGSYGVTCYSATVGAGGVACSSGTVSAYTIAAGAGGLSVNGTTRIDSSGNVYPYTIRYSSALIAGSGGTMPGSYSNALYVNDANGNYVGKAPLF